MLGISALIQGKRDRGPRIIRMASWGKIVMIDVTKKFTQTIKWKTQG